MSARKIYFDDLLKDCLEAVIEADIPEDQQPAVIAALIQSDSLNGLRKALLQNGTTAYAQAIAKGLS